MLKEIAPHIARAAFVANPKIRHLRLLSSDGRSRCAVARDRAVPSPVETAADIERAIELFARVPNGGLFLPPNTTNNVHRDLIIALAARHRLPAVYAFRFFVVDGGLMSYAIDQVDMFRQTASYVDRILRGANPVDIPVQAPTKYETAINLKTAKALGLTCRRGCSSPPTR